MAGKADGGAIEAGLAAFSAGVWAGRLEGEGCSMIVPLLRVFGSLGGGEGESSDWGNSSGRGYLGGRPLIFAGGGLEGEGSLLRVFGSLGGGR
jgi:hypothetical protein